MPLDQSAAGMDMGAPIMEPDLNGAKDGGRTELPKGGEI